MWAPVSEPAALRPIQLPAEALSKAAENSPSVWIPEPTQETRMEFRVPGFSLLQQFWD